MTPSEFREVVTAQAVARIGKQRTIADRERVDMVSFITGQGSPATVSPRNPKPSMEMKNHRNNRYLWVGTGNPYRPLAGTTITLLHLSMRSKPLPAIVRMTKADLIPSIVLARIPAQGAAGLAG